MGGKLRNRSPVPPPPSMGARARTALALIGTTALAIVVATGPVQRDPSNRASTPFLAPSDARQWLGAAEISGPELRVRWDELIGATAGNTLRAIRSEASEAGR